MDSRSRSRAARAAAVAGCLAASVAAAPTANAQIVLSDTEEWSELYVNTCDGPAGDVVIETELLFTQEYTIKRREPGTNRYWFSATTRIAETNTNVDTLRSWTVDTVIHEHDTSLVAVDGDVFTLNAVFHFRSVYNDEQGVPFDRSSGMWREVLEVDTQGTPDPEDDEGSFLEFVGSHGSPGPDFCEDALRETVE